MTEQKDKLIGLYEGAIADLFASNRVGANMKLQQAEHLKKLITEGKADGQYAQRAKAAEDAISMIIEELKGLHAQLGELL